MMRQYLAALRALLVFTLLLGLAYPFAIFVIGRIPGLSGRADGSKIVKDGRTVGSRLIGQDFANEDKYFQSRPGDYDPADSGPSNLGPEDIVDLPDRSSLLTLVCARSKVIAEREDADGSRPFCLPSGVGAALALFGPRAEDGGVPRPTRIVSVNEPCPYEPSIRLFKNVTVRCKEEDADLSEAKIVPVRITTRSPRVPADAVTAGGSGLDPHISPAYARLQIRRVARARDLSLTRVAAAVAEHTSGRGLGFLGSPRVNVLELNLALDAIK